MHCAQLQKRPNVIGPVFVTGSVDSCEVHGDEISLSITAFADPVDKFISCSTRRLYKLL